MKIFPTKQVKELDRYTIDHEPIQSIDLMERASVALFNWVHQHLQPASLTVFSGAGNNGGDALALARLAYDRGLNVNVYIIKAEIYSPDLQLNIERWKNLSNSKINYLSDLNEFPTIGTNDIVIDGIFGSGLNRPASGLISQLIQHINNSKAYVVSIDIPSGLFGEDNTANDRSSIVKATTTLSFQFPKLAFMFSENEDYVGDWHVLDIGIHVDALRQTPSLWHLLTHDLVQPILPKRNKFSHKGTYGHGLLISGSYGKMGAAVLSSRACLKSGVGLLTVHIPRLGYNIIQTAVPEAMVNIDRSDILFSEFPDLNAHSAIGVGPGLGTKVNSQKALRELLEQIKDLPLVLDADAINILSENGELLSLLPTNCILTPHPKEFERLVGTWNSDFDRLEKLVMFSKKYNVITILKGANTTISLPNGDCYFNTTGNAGMATAGSGDVLTGIVLAFLAQGLLPSDAALLAVYCHGLAGDIYAESNSQESLVAMDIVENLGKSFRELCKIRYFHQ